MDAAAPLEPPDLELGDLINHRYQVLARIGAGGVGTVYKVYDMRLDRVAALKLISQASSLNQRAVIRFHNEMRVISELEHLHTARLLDFGELEDGRPFMVLEYHAGGQLRDLLSRGRFAVRPSLQIARDLCRALAEAHAHGIIHRDLKPENVLFDAITHRAESVRLVDFGAAKLYLDAGAVTAPGTRIGTPRYMAPEQAFGQPIDHRADLYAVGTLLYEMLTGRAPFKAQDTLELCLEHKLSTPRMPSELSAELGLDPALERLLARLLAKRPEDRPESAAGVADEIEALLASMPVEPERPDPVIGPRLCTPAPVEDPPDAAWAPRRRRAWGLAFAVLAALAAWLYLG